MAQYDSSNQLLLTLSSEDWARLKPHLTPVTFAREQTLAAAHQPIDYAYFVESGVASIVSAKSQKTSTEVGTIGREGMSGISLLLGAGSSPHNTIVVVGDGHGLRIEAARLQEAVEASATLRAILLRYVQVYILQIAQSAVSNAHHRIEARLARWLLICHDRVDGDEISLTHEFMAMMIAAQRSGVTLTLHILEGAGMIRSKRGRVIIRDRAQLEALAGDGYGQPEAEYRRLIGPFGRGSSAPAHRPASNGYERSAMAM